MEPRALGRVQPPPPPAPDFRAVFESESAYVWHSLRHLGVRDADLEDLTHDVLITAYRRFDDFDTTRPIRPWLFGIALRLAWRYRQRAGHRLEVLDDRVDPVDDAPGPDRRLEARQDGELVLAALDRIGLEHKAVLVMHEIDGVAVTEIAVALEIPLNTAYSRLRLARVAFRRAVEEIQSRKGRQP